MMGALVNGVNVTGIVNGNLQSGHQEPRAYRKLHHSETIPSNNSEQSSQDVISFLPFKLWDCPNQDADSLRTEKVLLSWLIVLFRYSHDGAVAFSWGYSEVHNGGMCSSETVSTLAATDVNLDLSTKPTSVLSAVKSHSQQEGEMESKSAAVRPLYLMNAVSSTDAIQNAAEEEQCLLNVSLQQYFLEGSC